MIIAKLKLIPFAATLLSIGLALPAQASSPCRAYTVDDGSITYGFDEINNCPILNGTFSNSNWLVNIGQWEPAAYFYEGKNLQNGQSIKLIDFDVRGTVNRPQYGFKNGNTFYLVTFRPSDPNTIRVEIYQGSRRIFNQLLSRTVEPI